MQQLASSGTFTAGNRLRDPERQFAEIRQRVLDDLHRCIVDARTGWLFPKVLLEAITNEIWAHERWLDHKMTPAMPLLDFIQAPYPVGLGTTVDIVEKLIAGDEKAKLAWDRAVRGEHGGARNPSGTNQHTQPTPKEVKFNNVKLDLGPTKPPPPMGNSAQYGLRRLDKAAQDGDEQAVALLGRVLNPKDAMSVNSACIAMGWRKPPATVHKIGPIDTIKLAWKKATESERVEIAAWINEQMGFASATALRP